MGNKLSNERLCRRRPSDAIEIMDDVAGNVYCLSFYTTIRTWWVVRETACKLGVKTSTWTITVSDKMMGEWYEECESVNQVLDQWVHVEGNLGSSAGRKARYMNILKAVVETPGIRGAGWSFPTFQVHVRYEDKDGDTQVKHASVLWTMYHLYMSLPKAVKYKLLFPPKKSKEGVVIVPTDEDDKQ